MTIRQWLLANNIRAAKREGRMQTTRRLARQEAKRREFQREYKIGLTLLESVGVGEVKRAVRRMRSEIEEKGK